MNHREFCISEWHRQQWKQLYNCSIINIDAIPLEQRRRFGLESWILIVLCAIYYILYAPCLVSIRRLCPQNPCYQMLFFIGIMDVGILWVLGFLHGWLCLEGAVFCSHPLLIYWAGLGLTFFWCAESSADLLLAINRCLAILFPSVGNVLFSGWRTSFWLSLCTLYGFYLMVTVKPALFTSLIFSWPFNPFFGYRNDLASLFDWPFHIVHNLSVVILIPLIYLLFALGIYLKIRSFGIGLGVSNAEKMAFLQVFLLSSMNCIACSVYVSMHFVQPSQWILTLAHFAWLHIHGFPPVIFLLLNKTMRKECLMMFEKVAPRRNQVSNVITNVTTITQTQ